MFPCSHWTKSAGHWCFSGHSIALPSFRTCLNQKEPGLTCLRYFPVLLVFPCRNLITTLAQTGDKAELLIRGHCILMRVTSRTHEDENMLWRLNLQITRVVAMLNCVQWRKYQLKRRGRQRNYKGLKYAYSKIRRHVSSRKIERIHLS